MKKVVFILLILLIPLAFSIKGKETFSIIINPDIVGIDVRITPNPADWFDKIMVSGYAIPASGEIYTQKIEVLYQDELLCENYTDTIGYFECYFISDFPIGNYNLTIRAIRNDTGGVSGEKNVLFKVHPHLGKIPQGNIVSIEIPTIIQDINGKIKRVMVTVYFGY